MRDTKYLEIESSPMETFCPNCKKKVLSYELVKNNPHICDECIDKLQLQ